MSSFSAALRRHVVPALATLALWAAPLAAQTPQTATPPHAAAVPVPPLPQRPSIVVDAESGAVLNAVNPHMTWHPASLTKMMTVYTALQAVRAGRVRLDTPLTVSTLAASQVPAKMGFPPGSTVTLEAAIFILMVRSANDVSVTLAEGVSGSVDAFAAEMNATSRRLGMTGSVWRNPNGLHHVEQVTTARDMAVLARAIYRDFPEHRRFFTAAALQYGSYTLRNYNALIGRYPGADGLKTGFICPAGFNLVATATRGGRRHIAVVLGERSARGRAERAALLLERSWQGENVAQAGWFGPTRPMLDNLIRPTGMSALAPNLRQDVCERRGGASESEDTETATAPATPQPVLALNPDQSPALAGLTQPNAPAAVANVAGERTPLLAPQPQQVSAVVLSGYLDQPRRRGARARPVRISVAGTALVGQGLPVPPVAMAAAQANPLPAALAGPPPRPARRAANQRGRSNATASAQRRAPAQQQRRPAARTR
jgi:D-alanyl-D-alanine carboxypeptidase